MYGREELDVNKLVYATDIDTMLVDCEGTEVWPQDSDGCEYYFKSQADKVMDAMEARIKELEESLPKWISVKDRLPEEGVFVYAVGQHLEGLLCFKENEWYTKEEVEDEPDSYWELCGYDKDAIDYWMEKPLPPTTEESSAVDKEK